MRGTASLRTEGKSANLAAVTRAIAGAARHIRETYNATWLIERHGFAPPNAIRQDRASNRRSRRTATARCLSIRGRYTNTPSDTHVPDNQM